jgi:hypothetical protein
MTPDMKLDQFLRLHALRAPNVAWLLGAGASAAAGIPTAFDMIWDFKRTLFCAAQRVSLESCADLGDSGVRARLQRHFDDKGGFPPADSAEEYAAYFEAAYPDEGDRRRYIDRQLAGANPSFGHFALAALMRADRVRAAWTTNFDAMIEDGVAQIFGTTSRLTVATLDATALASQAMNEGRWPLLGKLHGDFRSRRLKNVPEELRAQDAALRHGLVECCRRFGLAVVGYSGRDASVMDALTEGVDGGRGYPAGLFWFHRGETEPLPAVVSLLEAARDAGIQAELIACETFDELMADLLLLERDLPDEVATLVEGKRKRRLSSAPIPAGGSSYPVIRTNALPVTSWPQTARLVECDIGGFKEVRAAVEKAGSDLLVTRRAAGVVAFGSDAEIRKAFAIHDIRRLDLYAIESRRLRYFDSAELGLLYDAITRALARELPLVGVRRRHRHRLTVDPAQANDARLAPLKKVVKQVTGTVGEHTWVEAVELHLEYRLDQVWLLLEPTIYVDAGGQPLPDATKEFIRSRLAGRFNKTWNELLDAWRDVLLGGETEREFRAFDIGDGIDASFVVGPVTAFSRRAA